MAAATVRGRLLRRPPQFAGVWPPSPPPLMAQQGAAGDVILQPQQFAAGGYGGPHEVGEIRRSLPPLPLLAQQGTARGVVGGALHDHGVGLVSQHGAQHGSRGGGS